METATTLENALNRAMQYQKQGDYTKALASYQEIIKQEPNNAEAFHLLGMLYHLQEQSEKALPFLIKAVELKPQEWRYHYGLGAVYRLLQNWEEALRYISNAVEIAPDNPKSIEELILILNNMGSDTEKTVSQYKTLHQFLPDNADIQLALWDQYRKNVRSWHFSMMNDTKRNDAYEGAIRDAVTEKSHVLEIGTGSGLLAMMAARAGAKEVITCEAVKLIASKAKEIIAKNGFEDRIHVIPKPSFELSIGKDGLKEKCDILITETFGSSLIDEGVLPIITHAKKHLLKEDAVIIPAKASISVMFIECEELKHYTSVENVSGFDLSPFNEFTPRPRIPVTLTNHHYTALSEPLKVLEYDFARDELGNQTKDITLSTIKSGTCHGIVYWFALYLDENHCYDNSPLDPSHKTEPHWVQCFQAFTPGFSVKAGREVSIRIEQKEKSIIFKHKV